jgi:hypothetical protein
MRLSAEEPAAVVLARLQASAPKQSLDPRNPDPTFEARYLAWQDAVKREQHWAAREAAGQERGPWPPA